MSFDVDTEQFVITPQQRQAIIARLFAIALSESSTPREAIKAARTLIYASSINLKAIALAVELEHKALLDRVAKLEQARGKA
jgi:hypothetical protein